MSLFDRDGLDEPAFGFFYLAAGRSSVAARSLIQSISESLLGRGFRITGTTDTTDISGGIVTVAVFFVLIEDLGRMLV